jgi:hypothetical protein
VIALPRHLSPWAPELGLFPEEIALVLGSVVSRLAGVLGDTRLARSGEGLPDGYDGIVNRGTYDRLLSAEWLLLDELPDEFMRRVVSGEHSFLRRARRRASAGARSVALFDAGVDQLGAPRIAQLALLILLARRAEQQGARFEWGTLQDPDLQRHSAVTEASVLDLLRGRCLRAAAPHDVDRWIDGDPGPKPSELWLIGAARLASEAARHRACSVVVYDVLEPGVQRLRVEARSIDRVRAAVLEVPEQRLAVQLLRDPFSAAVGPRLVMKTRIDPRSNLMFSPDGRQLHGRSGPSTLVTLRVPNSPRDPARTIGAVSVPDDHVIIAVGRSYAKKRAVLLSRCGSASFIHVLSRRGTSITHSTRFTPAEGYEPPPEDAAPRLRPLGMIADLVACYLDAEGHVIRLSNGQATRKEQIPAIASSALRDQFIWVSLRDRVLEATLVTTEGRLITPQTLGPSPPLIAKFCFGAWPPDLHAHSTANRTWNVVHQRNTISIAVDDRLAVVGVISDHAGSRQPGLLALDEQRTRVTLLQRSGALILFGTAAPIAAIATSPSGRDVAYLTQDSEVGIYSCTFARMTLRAPGGEL